MPPEPEPSRPTSLAALRTAPCAALAYAITPVPLASAGSRAKTRWNRSKTAPSEAGVAEGFAAASETSVSSAAASKTFFRSTYRSTSRRNAHVAARRWREGAFR